MKKITIEVTDESTINAINAHTFAYDITEAQAVDAMIAGFVFIRNRPLNYILPLQVAHDVAMSHRREKLERRLG